MKNVLCFSLLLIAASLATAAPAQPSEHPKNVPQEMKVDLSAQPLGKFLGLGVQFDPYVNQVDAHRWAEMMDHLAHMKPGFLRVMSGATDYCSGFDAKGEPIYRWDTDPKAPQFQAILTVLDFAQAHHIEVYLGEWSPPGSLGIHSPDDPRWQRIISDFVQYLVRDRHYTVIHHYIFMNEPNGDWMWHGRKPDFTSWSTGVRNLRHQLDARGLDDVILTGPDNSGGRQWFDRTVTEMHDVFGAWEQHIYAKDQEVESGTLERELISDHETILKHDPDGAGKPRFIAESGLVTGKIQAVDQQPRVHDFDYGARMADYIVQVARAGWGGADAWDLDDAMHRGPGGGWKVWGFFDSNSDAGMKPRPWYYAWTILSRSMPKGAEILPVTGSSETPVRATIAKWNSSGKTQWTLVLVNHTDAPASVNLKLPKQKELHVFRYFATEQNVDGALEPKESELQENPQRTQTVSLPSRGVVVLTTAPQSTSGAARQTVLNYLKSISGSRTAVGVQNKDSANPTRDSDRIASLTGKQPSFWGADFSYGQRALDKNRQTMINEAIAQYKAGALVGLMYHACAPILPDETCDWNSVGGSNPVHLTNDQWNQLTTPGTGLYKTWIARLDKLSVYFQQLKDADVAVLFRPLHEMNQCVFWWGCHLGPNGSAKLYQITHDYLVNVKGFDNIIWVWNVQDFDTLDNDVNSYNPGSSYFDIAALDVYNTGYTQNNYNAMLGAAKGKPIAVAECQYLPTPDLLARQNRWVYVMLWSDFISNPRNQIALPTLYKTPNIVTLDQMPGWGTR